MPNIFNHQIFSFYQNQEQERVEFFIKVSFYTAFYTCHGFRHLILIVMRCDVDEFQAGKNISPSQYETLSFPTEKDNEDNMLSLQVNQSPSFERQSTVSLPNHSTASHQHLDSSAPVLISHAGKKRRRSSKGL